MKLEINIALRLKAIFSTENVMTICHNDDMLKT